MPRAGSAYRATPAVAAVAAGLGMIALAGVSAAEEIPQTPQSGQDWDGILPSLSALWFLPESVRLRYPGAVYDPAEDSLYERRFPLFAQEALDRGFVLPKPFGVTVVGVSNSQLQLISDVSVALGKGAPPPSGTELVPIPFVELDDVISDTDSLQIKADMWLLPNVNVFGTLGRVEGSVDLDVVVDPTGLLPPAACPPPDGCDPLRASFTAGVSSVTATLGVTGVYGWDNWFTTGTLSGTASVGDNTDTTIRTVSANARLGRRWVFGRGHLAAPYIGASYFDLDQIVEGTTRLPDAFPDGDSLDVRYRARTENAEKWSFITGVNLGFTSGYSVGLELGASENSRRLVLTGTRRF